MGRAFERQTTCLANFDPFQRGRATTTTWHVCAILASFEMTSGPLGLPLVLSCFFRVHPLGGLFMARAEAGRHCAVQSITPSWAERSGLMHLNHLEACAALTHVCPS